MILQNSPKTKLTQIFFVYLEKLPTTNLSLGLSPRVDPKNRNVIKYTMSGSNEKKWLRVK